MRQTVIKLEKISKTYGKKGAKVVALKNVSLSINKGEFIALMGPSGSGKSTLLNIIGLLDKADRGRYFFKTEDITKKSKTVLANLRNKEIGFVFQTFNLLPRISALKNVALPLIYKKSWQSSADPKEVLRKVGMEKRAKHKPNELSGGEKQRTAIARALVNRPSIILADEPTGNLDSKSGKQIMELFSKLNKEGVTILMVTHEHFIADYADKTIRMKDGEII